MGLGNAAAGAVLLNKRLGTAAGQQPQVGMNSGKMGNDDSTNVITRCESTDYKYASHDYWWRSIEKLHVFSHVHS